MEHGSFVLRCLALVVLAAPFTANCGGDRTADGQVLDASQPRYGLTYDQWSAKWWEWVYQLDESQGCYVPVQDPTGANCATGQSGDVFFLAGTAGGTVVRNDCDVPRGAAIFFPIVTTSGDNAGVPAAMQLTDEGLKQYVETTVDTVPLSSLSVEFDGAPVTDLARFEVKAVQYSYMLSPEPNLYTCEGETGVTGDVPVAYEGGYFVMLAPPAPGPHTLHFTGTSPGSMAPTMVDVTYNFKIQ